MGTVLMDFISISSVTLDNSKVRYNPERNWSYLVNSESRFRLLFLELLIKKLVFKGVQPNLINRLCNREKQDICHRMPFKGETAHYRGFLKIILRFYSIYRQILCQNQEWKLLITEFIPLLHKRLINRSFWKFPLLIVESHFYWGFLRDSRGK